MPKLTKTQAKRLCKSIQGKATKLFTMGAPNGAGLTVAEFNQINSIMNKLFKKIN